MHLLNLPKYVLIEICTHLQLKELCVLSSTCKTFHKITESDQLWKGTPGSGEGPKLKHDYCIHSSILHSIHSRIYQLNILSGHTKQINSISIKKNKVLTCSEDKSVHIWNLKKKIANQIITHADSAISANFCENGIISISLDKTMKIWRKNQKAKSINAHAQGVTHLNKIDENRFITASEDGFVKIWDTTKGANLISNQEFNKKVHCIENNQQYYCFSCPTKKNFGMRDFEKPDVLMELKQ